MGYMFLIAIFPIGWIDIVANKLQNEPNFSSKSSPMPYNTSQTQPYAPARYLQDETDIVLFLEAAAEEALEAGDNNILLAAIEAAAKARGMMEVAKQAGVSRESLYKSLAPNAKPRYETIIKILDALGVKISFTAKNPPTPAV